MPMQPVVPQGGYVELHDEELKRKFGDIKFDIGIANWEELSRKLVKEASDVKDVKYITKETIPPQYKERKGLEESGAFVGDDGFLYILIDNVDDVDEVVKHEKAHKLLEPHSSEMTSQVIPEDMSEIHRIALNNIGRELQASLLTYKTFGFPKNITHALQYQLQLHLNDGISKDDLYGIVDYIIGEKEIPDEWVQNWRALKENYQVKPATSIRVNKYRRMAPAGVPAMYYQAIQQAQQQSQPPPSTPPPLPANIFGVPPPPVATPPSTPAPFPANLFGVPPPPVATSPTSPTPQPATVVIVPPVMPTPPSGSGLPTTVSGLSVAQPTVKSDVVTTPQSSDKGDKGAPTGTIVTGVLGVSSGQGTIYGTGDNQYIVINGKQYGVGKPLEGEYQYYDPIAKSLVAGTYRPLTLSSGTNQPSNATLSLVNQIMQKTGCSMQEALDAITFVASQPKDIQTGNALITKNPELITLLTKNVVGDVFKDIHNGVPIVAKQEATDAKGKSTGKIEETVVILKPEEATNLSNLSPQQQFESLQNMGVYPPSWTYVKVLDKDGKLTGGIFQQSKAQEDATLQLQKTGAIDANGQLNLQKAVDAGISDITIFKAGYNLELYKPEDVFKYMQTHKGEVPTSISPTIAQAKLQTELQKLVDKFKNYIVSSEEIMGQLGIDTSKPLTLKTYDSLTNYYKDKGNAITYDINKLVKAYNNNDITKDDIEKLLGKGAIDSVLAIAEWNKLSSKVSQSNVDKLRQVADNNNIKVKDYSNLSQDDVDKLVSSGVSSALLVASGANIDYVNNSVDKINNALEKLSSYADKVNPLAPSPKIDVEQLKEATYSLPTPSFSISGLARFQREHPEDTTTLALLYPKSDSDTYERVINYNKLLDTTYSYMREEASKGKTVGTPLGNAFWSLGYSLEPKLSDAESLAKLNLKWEGSSWAGKLSGHFVDTKTGKELPYNEYYTRLWDFIPANVKEQAANIVIKDTAKGSKFAEDVKSLNIIASKFEELFGDAKIDVFKILPVPVLASSDKYDIPLGKLASGLVFTPSTGVLNTPAKWLTLKDAQIYLNDYYKTELNAVKEYRNKDGTINIDKLSDAMIDSPKLKEQVLKDAGGYKNFDDLKTNLEGYNNGVKVTGLEWGESAAMLVLDGLMAGGGEVLGGIGGTIGKTAITTGSAIAGGISLGAAGVFMPSIIKAVANPNVSTGEKILAIGGEVLLIGGGALGLKGTPKETAVFNNLGEAKVPSGETVIKAVVSKEGEIPLEKPISATPIQKAIDTVYGTSYKLGEIYKVAKPIVQDTIQGAINAGKYIRYDLGDDIVGLVTFIKEELPSKITDFTKQGIENAINAAMVAKWNIKYGISDVTASAIRASKEFISELASDVKGAYDEAIRNVEVAKYYAKYELPEAINNAVAKVSQNIANTAKTIGWDAKYGISDEATRVFLNSKEFANNIGQSISDSISTVGWNLKYGVTDDAVRALLASKEFTDKVVNNARIFGWDVKYGIPDEAVRALISSKEFINNVTGDIKTGLVNTYDTISRNALTADWYAKYELKEAINQSVNKILEEAHVAGWDAKYGISDEAIRSLIASKEFAKHIADKVSEYGVQVKDFTKEQIDNLITELKTAQWNVEYGIPDEFKEVWNKIGDTISETAKNAYNKSLNDVLTAKWYLENDLPDTIHNAITSAIDNARIAEWNVKYGITDEAVRTFIASKDFVKFLVEEAKLTTDKIKDMTVEQIQNAINSAMVAKWNLKYGISDTMAKVLSDSKQFINDVSLNIKNNIIRSEQIAEWYIKNELPTIISDSINSVKQNIGDNVALAKWKLKYGISDEVIRVLLTSEEFITKLRENIADGLSTVKWDLKYGIGDEVREIVNSAIEKTLQAKDLVVKGVPTVTKEIIAGSKELVGLIGENIRGAIGERWNKFTGLLESARVETASGFKDALAGKPREFTYVQALKDQVKAHNLLVKQALSASAQAIIDSNNVIKKPEQTKQNIELEKSKLEEKQRQILSEFLKEEKSSVDTWPKEQREAYQKWGNDLTQYSDTKLELEQLSRRLDDILLEAPQKGEAEIIAQMTSRIQELKSQLAELKKSVELSADNLVDSVTNAYADVKVPKNEALTNAEIEQLNIKSNQAFYAKDIGLMEQINSQIRELQNKLAKGEVDGYLKDGYFEKNGEYYKTVKVRSGESATDIAELKDQYHRSALDMNAVTKEIVNPRTVDVIKSEITKLTNTIDEIKKTSGENFENIGVKIQSLQKEIEATINSEKRATLQTELNKLLAENPVYERIYKLQALKEENYWSRLGQTPELYKASKQLTDLVSDIKNAPTVEMKAELLIQLNELLVKEVELKKLFAESIYRTTEEAERYTMSSSKSLTKVNEDISLLKKNNLTILKLEKELSEATTPRRKVTLSQQIDELKEINKVLNENIKKQFSDFAPYYERVKEARVIKDGYDYRNGKYWRGLEEVTRKEATKLIDVGTDFGGVMYKLQYSIDRINAKIGDIKLSEQISKNLKDLMDATSNSDKDGIVKASNELSKNKSEIQSRLKEYLDKLEQAKQAREDSFRKWDVSKNTETDKVVNQYKTEYDNAVKKEADIIKQTSDELLKEQKPIEETPEQQSWKKAKEEWDSVQKRIKEEEQAKLSEEEKRSQQDILDKQIKWEKEQENISNLNTLESTVSDLEKMLKESADTAKDSILREVDEILKQKTEDVKLSRDIDSFLRDIESKLKETPKETKPILTDEAIDFMNKVEAGQAPTMDMTNNLRRIAKENGIELDAGSTWKDVYQKLLDKKAKGESGLGGVGEKVKPEEPTPSGGQGGSKVAKEEKVKVGEEAKSPEEIERLYQEEKAKLVEKMSDEARKKLEEAKKKVEETTKEEPQKEAKPKTEPKFETNWFEGGAIGGDSVGKQAEIIPTFFAKPIVIEDKDKKDKDKTTPFGLVAEPETKPAEPIISPEEPLPDWLPKEPIVLPEEPKVIPGVTPGAPEKEPPTKPVIIPEPVKIPEPVEPEKEPVKIPEPIKEPDKEPVKIPEPIKEPEKEPSKEPAKEPIKEPEKEPTKEPVKEPIKEPTKEPVKEPDTKTRTITEPAIKTEPSTKTEPATKTEPSTKTQPFTQTQPEVKPLVEVQTKTLTDIKEETKPLEETQPLIKPLTEIKPITLQPTPEPPPPEEKIIKPIPLDIPSMETGGGGKKVRIPDSSLSWRQGQHWGYITPEEIAKPSVKKEIIWLKEGEIPEGVWKIATGKGSAYKTLQVIPQGAKLPVDEATVDMGWATVNIKQDIDGNLSMDFTGGKEAVEERWAQEEADAQAQQEALQQSRQPQVIVINQAGQVQTPETVIQKQEKVIAEDNVGKTLNKQLLPEYSQGDIKVYSVDDAFIRNEYAEKSIGDRNGIDFVLAGHNLVYYDLIPKNEVWVSQYLLGNDREAVIIHELAEYNKMKEDAEKKKQEHLTYDEYADIHEEVANPVEIEVRKNPDKAPELFEEQLGYNPDDVEKETPKSQKEIVDIVSEAIGNYEKTRARRVPRKPKNFDRVMEERWGNDEEEETPRPTRRSKRGASQDESGLRSRYYLGHKLPDDGLGY